MEDLVDDIVEEAVQWIKYGKPMSDHGWLTEKHFRLSMRRRLNLSEQEWAALQRPSTDSGMTDAGPVPQGEKS
jgi:hypothetical protein